MDAFRLWYIKHYVEITWFIIGWLVLATGYDIAAGNWLGVILDLVLIGINYIFYRR